MEAKNNNLIVPVDVILEDGTESFLFVRDGSRIHVLLKDFYTEGKRVREDFKPGCVEEFGFLGHQVCTEPLPEDLTPKEKAKEYGNRCKRCWDLPAERRF